MPNDYLLVFHVVQTFVLIYLYINNIKIKQNLNEMNRLVHRLYNFYMSHTMR